MPPTDGPLKQLINDFIEEFAAWLLDAEVSAARPLNVELQGTDVAVDQLFHVTLADGRERLLHIEFQGRRSHEPMRWRMLDYMARLARLYRSEICSLVLYVGRGAGLDDEGYYQLDCLDGAVALAWRYRVIRLWQMQAEELLALGRLPLLALIGQTEIREPETVLPQVVARIRALTDKAQQGRLATAMLALLSDEEMVQMVEKLIENEELLLDTPYLRRVRHQEREEGREEGREEERRRSILEVIRLRFAPASARYERLEQQVARIESLPRLEALFAATIQSARLEEVEEALREPGPDRL